MTVYEVTYFDEADGQCGTMILEASGFDSVVDKVERMGEYEVIEVEIVDRL